MTANWYGDEANIMSINFYLVALAELTHLSTENEKLTVEKLADDVMLRANNNIFDCHVAITEAELALITKQPKLLSGYLAKKLTKVLNLIADKQQLIHI